MPNMGGTRDSSQDLT